MAAAAKVAVQSALAAFMAKIRPAAAAVKLFFNYLFAFSANGKRLLIIY